MTFDEFKQELTEIVSKPDEMLANLPAFFDKVKSDYETRDAFKAATETQDAKIRSLQDTNIKLFLQQTHQVTEEEKEEKEKTFDDIISDINKEDSENG